MTHISPLTIISFSCIDNNALQELYKVFTDKFNYIYVHITYNMEHRRTFQRKIRLQKL